MTDDPIALDLFNRWQFEPKSLISEGYCSKVFLDESRALKVPFQGEEQSSGLRAFLAYPESIRPKVYQFDESTGSILMERLMPGTILGDRSISLETSTTVFTEAARTIANIEFDNPIPLTRYMERHGPLSKYMLETTEREVFLHGDLHHWNILKHADGWKVIDAKGLFGDPAYEAAAFIMNPLDQLKEHTKDYTRHRIELLSTATGCDAKRMLGWAILRFDPSESDKDSPCGFQHPILKQLAIEFGLAAELIDLA
ncbi:MAG TPA: aminoglycoside phosphotransferase family protein [Fimbriimonas sp.]|nr:aminoglycoside phosphotransferase family protein [Fimbriimonas sp.]